MGVWRKWVFPSLRIVVFAAIAVALVKLAFFPADTSEARHPSPTGMVQDSVVAATLGSITNNIEVSGAIVADAAVPARAATLGEVAQLHVEVGASVDKGAPLVTVRKEIEQEPIVRMDAEGNPTTVIPKPKYSTAQIVAPISGTVSALPLVVGQAVAIGDTAAQVAPTAFSVVGTIDPAQQFRLIEQPTEAQVSVQGGPDQFTCTGLTITTPLAGASAPEGEPGAPAGGSGPQVKCAVPAEVRVFAGLTGTMTLPGASAENVLVLPVTAVKGTSQAGMVWAVTADGVQEQRDVVLGLNNGTLVEVREGLSEGDEVLEFIPVTDPTKPPSEQGDNCYEMPDGGMVCESGA